MTQPIHIEQPLGDIRDGRVYMTPPWFRWAVDVGDTDLTQDVSGILPIANGGTGNSTGSVNLSLGTGIVPVVNGGTGNSTGSVNLSLGTGIAPAVHGGTGNDGTVLSWTPADGSGAGLVLTIISATYWRNANQITGQMHVVYPPTASGLAATIIGLPVAAAHINCAAMYSSGAGGGTAVQIAGTSINPFAPGNVAITNANLSGTFLIVSFTYLV